MPMRGKLKPNDESIIRQNYVFLKEEIDARHVVDYLYSRDVFTLDDKEEITAQVTKSKRNEVLIDKLLHAGPGNAFSEFLNALNNEYRHVVQKLKSTKVDAPQKNNDDYFTQLPNEFKLAQISDSVASHLPNCFGNNWESFMIELGHTKATIDREKQNCLNNVFLTITCLLIKWRQKNPQLATYGKFIECLESASKSGAVTIEFEEIKNIFTEESKKFRNIDADNVLETLPKLESGK